MRDIISLSTASFEHLEPARPYHRDENVACAYSLVDGFGEVRAGSDILHVHEHMLRAERGFQSVADSPRVGSRILPPITHEDFSHPSYVGAPAGFTPEMSE